MFPIRSARILRSAAFVSVVMVGAVACSSSSDEQDDDSAALEASEPEAAKCLNEVGPCIDIRDTESPPTGPSGEALVFDCYGACGASCNLIQKKTESATRCQEWKSNGSTLHRVLTYQVVSGSTHEFCTFHDSCYLECGKKYDESDSQYSCCTKYCDYACEDPRGFNDSCQAGRYAPKDGAGPLAALAHKRVCGNIDDFVAPTCAAGHVPNAADPTWSKVDCGIWATTAVGHDPGRRAQSTGRTAFTRLIATGSWSQGACPR